MRFRTGATAGLATAMAFMLTACGDSGENAAPKATLDPVKAEEAVPANSDRSEVSRITLLADGFSIAGPEDAQFRYGHPIAQVLAATGKILGEARQDTNEECGEGPLQFADFGEMRVTSQQGKFTGWGIDSGDAQNSGVVIAGQNGLAIGASKSAIEQLSNYNAQPESTLGDEFLINGNGYDAIVGLFGETGRVESLWSGMACTFR